MAGGRLFEEMRFYQKMYSPESFILPFFTGKVDMVIVLEGGLAYSRSNFSLKLVVERRRLLRFRAKMTLVQARPLISIEKISFS